MKITRAEVQHVAQLARLAVTDDEADRLAVQLSSLLEYVEKLGELALDGVEPTAHVHEIVNAMRDDVAVPSLPREEALSNAPAVESGCFRVPKVIEA